MASFDITEQQDMTGYQSDLYAENISTSAQTGLEGQTPTGKQSFKKIFFWLFKLFVHLMNRIQVLIGFSSN